MSVMPLLERQPLFSSAIDGVQTHAPMRSGIGDSIVFGL
jgi:hypothetical protein